MLGFGGPPKLLLQALLATTLFFISTKKRIEKKIGKTIRLDQKEQSEEITNKEIKEHPPLQEDSLEENLPAENGNIETTEEVITAEPKIYDASVRSAEEAKERKPSIAEVLAANKSAVNRVNGSDFSAPKEVEFPGYKLPDIDLLNFESSNISHDQEWNDHSIYIKADYWFDF